LRIHGRLSSREKKLNIVTLNVMPMAMKPSARIAVEALFAVLPALPAVSP
jgi:ribosomal protein L23